CVFCFFIPLIAVFLKYLLFLFFYLAVFVSVFVYPNGVFGWGGVCGVFGGVGGGGVWCGVFFWGWRGFCFLVCVGGWVGGRGAGR
ncbi:hypothetical protein ACNIUU_26965, partial [Escherichia coli]